MVEVIGVRFRTNGKIYYFNPGSFDVKTGDHVIVETIRGVEYGSVVMGKRQIEDADLVATLKPIIRIATPRDDAQNARNQERCKEAFEICQKKIEKHKLEMKLIDVEYTFDNNKLLFYFSADGRVDFRELVRDLATEFHTRIELRQIGVRDEAKMLGGIGICGRPLCCSSYLSEFASVSIKMAKEQNLSLNPTKISGVCGRLMCCLKNEQDTYEYLNRKLPSVGDYVTGADGLSGDVQNVSVLRQRVKVIVTNAEGDKEVREYAVDDLVNIESRKGGRYNKNGNRGGNDRASQSKESEQEDAELKRLEQADAEELAKDKNVPAERRRDNRNKNQNREERRYDGRHGNRERGNKDDNRRNRDERKDTRNRRDGRKEYNGEGRSQNYRRTNRGERRYRNEDNADDAR